MVRISCIVTFKVLKKFSFKPTEINLFIQGRSQELEMGGAKLLGKGSRGRLRPPVGQGQSPGRGARGAKPPGSSRVLNI